MLDSWLFFFDSLQLIKLPKRSPRNTNKSTGRRKSVDCLARPQVQAGRGVEREVKPNRVIMPLASRKVQYQWVVCICFQSSFLRRLYIT